MIYYLVTRDHSYTICEYLTGWGRALQGKVEPIFYDQIATEGTLRRGTYIFSDLERLDPAYMELAGEAWSALEAAGGCRLLNNPHQVLRREPMLRALHKAGVNPFSVYRVNEDLSRVRFPAFIRTHNAHDGAITELIDSAQALEPAIRKARATRDTDEELLIVEYSDTRDPDGVFRKYGAFRVGDRIIPRHVLVSREWMLKYPDMVDDSTVEEERKYLAENPHEGDLKAIFDFARIEYGRIDYSLKDGQIVTWEINTNPTMVVPRERLAESRKPLQRAFMNPYAEAIEKLGDESDGKAIPFPVRRELLSRLRLLKSDLAMKEAKKKLGMMIRNVATRLKKS
jgi:hypothetical protein